MNTKNETEEYYYDLHGRLTYKAQYHLNRGECCFNYCLHCPYGTSVEKYGLKAQQIEKSIIEFSLKGYSCARYNQNDGQWNIFPHFKAQNLEDDLSLALRIFDTSKDEQLK